MKALVYTGDVPFFFSVTNYDSSEAMGAHCFKNNFDQIISEFQFKCFVVRKMKCNDFVDRNIWKSAEIKYRQQAINLQLMGNRKHNLF